MSDVEDFHGEEHRSGHDRRREPTRRDVDKRLLRVLIGLALVFLIVSGTAAVVALINSHDVEKNAKALEHQRRVQLYERDIAKWHADYNGCIQGTAIFRTLLKRDRSDAKLFRDQAIRPEVRRYFRKRVAGIDAQLAVYKPKLCKERFKKPRTPKGLRELP